MKSRRFMAFSRCEGTRPSNSRLRKAIGNPGKARFVLLLLCCVLLLLSVGGCGFGTRYIFSSTRDIISTPQQHGLAYEEVLFFSEDGVRLHGWYIPGRAEKPLVLFFHGNAANISHRVENLQYLHGMGYSVFIFDYRGFGMSEGRALREDDLQRDARGALAWLAQRGWTPQRMVYFGLSMGASVAVALALESPPAGVILEAPFTSLPEIVRTLAPLAYYFVGWWSIDSRFDNLEQIDRLQVPLLIFHGDRDAVVPPAMSRRLFARAREPKTYVLVEGAGHSDAYAVGGERYRDAWLGFTDTLPLAPARH